MSQLLNRVVQDGDGASPHAVPSEVLNWNNPIETWVSEKPVQALLIALAGGVVLGWLIKRM